MMINQELYEKRIKVCKSCDTFDTKTKKCDKKKGGCGCFMFAKARLRKAKCPKQKWNEISK